MLKAHIELLQKQLSDLHHVVGESFAEITRRSGVHNLQKILSGNIEPTNNSWLRLHQAYPEHISEPVYIDGSRVYRNVITGTGNVIGSGLVAQIGGGVQLGAEEQALINALREYGDKAPRVMRKILGMIDEIAEKIA
jgi:hypothetical protein